ncbi:hypothetical protein LWI29_032977 [Acer saccharum]|uniref:Trichome birefringence-like C-terminal domain-containing protein n=1 Tax=Acer saccharum TaxID=4024 RepID=A0AA39SHV4_ACESA|nr:hypothetical protein LWI29_032977 [Acer saccharum]
MKTPLSSSSSYIISKACLSPYLFTLLAFIVFVAILYVEEFICILGQLNPLSSDTRPISTTKKNREKLRFAVGKTGTEEEGCDVFSGRWVRDMSNRPVNMHAWLDTWHADVKGSFDDEEKETVELPTEDACRMAMKSMLRWVNLNMDRKKTRVFFTSVSPSRGKWVYN